MDFYGMSNQSWDESSHDQDAWNEVFGIYHQNTDMLGSFPGMAGVVAPALWLACVPRGPRAGGAYKNASQVPCRSPHHQPTREAAPHPGFESDLEFCGHITDLVLGSSSPSRPPTSPKAALRVASTPPAPLRPDWCPGGGGFPPWP